MAEVSEEIAEAAEFVAEVARDPKHFFDVKFMCVAAAGGAVVGGAVAWKIAYKRAQAYWTKIAEDEIEVVKDHYAAKVEAVKNEQAKGEVGEIINSNGYGEVAANEVIAVTAEEEVVEVVEEADVVGTTVRNVFEEASAVEPEWDYAKEVKSRDPRSPYVIHAAEFKACEKGYDQAHYTYYEDDDVLADSDDTVIDEVHEVVGVENLEKFGHGSEDPNIVFVRNDVRELDVEIARSTGSYAEEVHGLKHSEPMRRQRPWDG